MGTEDLCEFRGTASSPNNSTATVTFVMKANSFPMKILQLKTAVW